MFPFDHALSSLGFLVVGFMIHFKLQIYCSTQKKVQRGPFSEQNERLQSEIQMCDQKDLINTLFKFDCLFSCCFKGVRERSLGTVLFGLCVGK